MNRGSIALVVALATASIVLAAPASGAGDASRAPAQVSAQRIAQADREPNNWMAHGRTYSEERFSPLDQISDKNVGTLGLAWFAKLDVDHGTEATPIVVDGVMYTTGARSIVYAFDARNGKLSVEIRPQGAGGDARQGLLRHGQPRCRRVGRQGLCRRVSTAG